MTLDLHNFFKYYDDKNANHVAAVQWLEDNLPSQYLDDTCEWIKLYRERPKSSVLNVPYFPQTDNYTNAERTCNSSSCAMCLEFFKPGTLKGAQGDDAYVKKVFEIGDTTDHAVQTKVLSNYGIQSEFRYNLSFADIDKELDAGRPVVIGILHRGTLQNPTGGHMCVVIGHSPDKKGYVVNDPYGSLNDNYTGPVENGKGTIYSKHVLKYRWCPGGNDGWGRIFKV